MSTLAVVARVLDEETGLVSEPSPALRWNFERPTVILTDPSGGPLVGGDILVDLGGLAGQVVQVIIDGVPTGRYHKMPQQGALVWRDVAPGTHELAVRYVMVGEGSEKVVTAFGPVRSSQVTVEQSTHQPVQTHRLDDAQPVAWQTPRRGAPPLWASSQTPDSRHCLRILLFSRHERPAAVSL